MGRIFSESPDGWFTHHEIGHGRAEFAAVRRGRRWSAHQDGELVRFRIRLKEDGFPRSLQVSAGKLLSSQYASTPLEMSGDPRILAAPTVFRLGANHPNPFNPSTVIPFDIPAAQDDFAPVSVSVLIFNALGQRVRDLLDGPMVPGFHRATWDGRDNSRRPLGTGVYFYQVRVGQQLQTGKMTMLR